MDNERKRSLSDDDETGVRKARKTEEGLASSVEEDSKLPAETESAEATAEGAVAAASSHAFDDMENVDIPEYVTDHSGTLTFPEKVSRGMGARCKPFYWCFRNTVSNDRMIA